MHLPARHLTVVALAVSVAACASAGSPAPASPMPVPSPSASNSAIPSASPDVQGYWLRLTTTQALPPLNLFGAGAALVITASGTVVTPGPIPAIYPGPLVVPLIGRSITDAGRARILKLATDLGLLGQRTDFSGGQPIAGGVTARVEILVNGRLVTITGPTDVPACTGGQACSPAPGTPEAFGVLRARLLDLSSWLAADLGLESPYLPAAYSVLIGSAPVPDPTLRSDIAQWPLATPMASFGVLVANGTARCGMVTGPDVAIMRVALGKAHQLTQWVEGPTSSASYGLTIRALTPGEDACREVFGAG